MKLKREIDKESDSKRYISFLLIVATIFSLLILRLYYLQIINEDYYKEKAFKNSFRENILKATRGKIYDVNGELLADNSTGYKLVHKDTPFITSQDKKDLMDMNENGIEIINNFPLKRKTKLEELFFDIDYMSKIANLDFESVLDIFYKTTPFGFDKEIVVDDDIPIEKALIEVEKLPNDRIDIVEYNKRKYVKKDLASHIVGYVKHISNKEYEKLKSEGYNSDDLIGKKGVEKEYDKRIKGIDGYKYVEVDAKGNIITSLDEIKAIKGDDVYLSIDSRLQEYMTEYMRDKVGAFIAIDVKTGKILTFVSSPEIDSNFLSSKINVEEWEKIVNSKKTPLLNKGLAGLYPPGSIFKPIVGAALLESGINPNEKIMSTGKFEYGGITFRDSHKNGHGLTNFNKAMEESVNTYYYDLSLKIPKENIFKVASNFGIGEKTDIDVSGELGGLLPTPEWKQKRFNTRQSRIWLPGDTINLSIGQGYLLVTPLQMVMVYQAIANDGVLMKPTVIDKFVSYNGEVEEKKPEVKTKLDISKKNLTIIQNALVLPVKGNRGTAHILNLPYVNVSAKTGTAQNNGGENHSWIAGYFPSEKPKIAFISFVEEGGYGGVAAGKQARKFIEKYYNKGEENINGEENNSF